MRDSLQGHYKEDLDKVLVDLPLNTLREMSNFVEFTGPWYSTTPGES